MAREEPRVPIIGVPNPINGTDADRAAFMAAMSTQIPQITDDPGPLWVEHKIPSSPAWVFVTADGETEMHPVQYSYRNLLEKMRELAAG